jgi:iron complex transport system substrate-binding protein
MKKFTLLLSLIILLLLTGCGAFEFFEGLFAREAPDDTQPPIVIETPEPEPFPVTIDGVVIFESPEDIISLSPSLSEILFEFGHGDRIIGKSEYCDFPRDLLTSAHIETIRGGIDLDIEMIISLSPNLLLLSSPIAEKDRMELERAGIATIVLPAPQDLDEFRNIYRLIGVILYGGFIGVDEGDNVFSPITLACNNPEVIDLGDFVYITENMLIATGDTLESAVFSCFGNNLAEESIGYVFDKEYLLENQPDIILLNSAISLEALKNDEIFSQLTAVTQEQVIAVNNLYFERPSARIVLLITEMQAKYKDLRT